MNIFNVSQKLSTEYCNISLKEPIVVAGTLPLTLIFLTVMLLMFHTLDQRLKLPVSLNSRFLRKSLQIDLVERSPAPILLLSAAALPKQFGESFDVMDIERRSLQESLVSHKR